MWRSLGVAVTAASLATAAQGPREPSEVRQFVTFKFLPGESQAALDVVRDEALPLYERNSPMERFRIFREVESPEPLDVVFVSTFRGMAGMDASNQRLREEAEKAGTSIGAIYGRIGSRSQYHRDEFVEIEPEASWGEAGDELHVFVSFRVAPGRAQAFEELTESAVVPWERKLEGVLGASGGRYLIADGWTHVRILTVSSLGAWHDYVTARRAEAWWPAYEELVVESKQVILAPVPELSVR